MLRTRAAILDAAAASVEEVGVRGTTMSDLAVRAGVAKATLYNHFRTKDDLLAALVGERAAALAADTAAVASRDGLEAALAEAVDRLASSKALARVVAEEPGVAMRLVVPDDSPGWEVVRAGVVQVLASAGAPTGRAPVDAVLRWLLGHALWPGTAQEAALGAVGLAAGLAAHDPAEEPPASSPAAVPGPTEQPVSLPRDATGQPVDAGRVAGASSGEGLGWPG